jgi:hypothetical protein
MVFLSKDLEATVLAYLNEVAANSGENKEDRDKSNS